MTQGKFERWSRTEKNPVLLEYYDLPEDLAHPISGFVDHCGPERDRHSLNHMTPVDRVYGRRESTPER